MSLIRKTNQQTLLDIYPTLESFKYDLTGDYKALAIDLEDATITTTYYLLIGRYGDSPILGYSDVGRWKLRLFTCYREYTPDWEIRTSIQSTIRKMSVDDIAKGDLSIFNSALNPNTEPSDTSNEELDYINNQSTTRHKLNTLDALLKKYDALDVGLDERYLDRFAKLFSKFALKDNPLYLYDDNEVNPYE